jgi:hypothetical protein
MAITPLQRRRTRRSGVAALAGLLAGLLVLVVPGQAQAHPHYGPGLDERFGTHCVLPSFNHIHILDPGTSDWVWGYEIQFVNPRFIKSEGRFSTNNTDVPQSVTFTSQVSQTVSISTTHTATTQVQGRFFDGLLMVQDQFSISRTVTQSTTTALGVNVTATAPPRTTVQGDYGVHVYDIGFIFRVYHRFPANQPCRLQGQTGTNIITVPTNDQGWQVSTFPAAGRATESVFS